MKEADLDNLLSKPQAVREILDSSFEIFTRFILDNHITAEPGKVHKDWYWLLQQDYSVAIACPRSHGKSTTFSLAYPLWQILSGRSDFIVIVSDTQDQANALLGSIIQELETNEKIIKVYGKIAGYIPPKAEDKQKWTAKEIVTTTNIKVIARGWKSKLRGIKHGAKRPDLIIIDDIENDEAVRSSDQRDKLAQTFYRSILNLGDKKTKTVMVGTILHFDSLLQNLINHPPPNWKAHLYRAIQDGKPIWSEYFSLEDLEIKKKQIGSVAFEQEWMNNPLDPSQQILNFPAYYDTLPDEEFETFGFIDLAISEKQTADFTAIATVYKSKKTGIVYVHDVIRFKGSIHRQLEEVIKAHARHQYLKFGVESVAYQKAFHQFLVSETRKQNIYIPAVEVKVDGDKIRRASSIMGYIENATIIVNRKLDDFISEAMQFPKGAHDDMVDAFVGAVRIAITGKKSVAVSKAK